MTEIRTWPTAGYGGGDEISVCFPPGEACCGEIVDGVSLQHGTEGSWVVSREMILEIADAIRAREVSDDD